MTCEAQAKNSMLMIKCVEPCIPMGEGSTIPPLGTLNATLTEFTSHSNNKKIGSTDNRYSEAYIGAFWLVTGRTEMSFSPDYDKGEIASMDTHKRYFRGNGSYTGTLGVNKEPGIPRWEAAVHGDWKADELRVGEADNYILYEFWVFDNPDRKDYGVTKADLLTKHYGIIFDTLEKSYDGAFTFSIPLSIIYKEVFPFWENGKVGSYDGDQWDVEILETPTSGNLNVGTWNEAGSTPYLPVTFDAVGDAGTLVFGDNGVSPAKALSMHTRLAFQIDGETTEDIVIQVSGMTIYDTWADETITLPATALGETYEVISQAYFHDDFYIKMVSGPAGSTVKIAVVDHILRTPYSGWPFIS